MKKPRQLPANFPIIRTEHIMENQPYKTASPAALLSRKCVAEALTTAGFPITQNTLRTKACRGGGPPYRTFGRATLYRWADALAWAEARLSAPRGSTSEADAQKSAA